MLSFFVKSPLFLHVPK